MARPDDLYVAGAAADIALDRARDLLLRRIRLFAQEGDRAHDHSGHAETALHGAGLDEGLLDGVQEAIAALQSLDGHDITTVEQRSRQQTGIDRLAVEQYCAGATFALAATRLGAGQLKTLAQQLGHRLRGRDLGGLILAIQLESDRDHDAASWSDLLTKTATIALR